MEFRILGPLEVEEHGQLITLGGPKERLLLGLLLLQANTVVPRDRLIEEIWHGSPPRSAIGTLQAQVSRLRQRLACGNDTFDRLVGRGGGYVLETLDDELDAYRFQRLAAAGRAAAANGEPSRAAELLAEALGLWRGSVLADLELGLSAIGAVARLDEDRVAVLEDRVEADLAVGRHHELCGELESVVAEHPLRERLSAQLMLALYRTDRQADALNTYERLRTLLLEELGVDPSSPTRQLHLAILQQRPELRSGSLVASGSASTNLPKPRTKLVGREDDLAKVADLLDVRSLVTLVGVAGAGKTRLAVEVAWRIANRFAEGVYFVDLSSQTDATGMLGLVTDTLGVSHHLGTEDKAGISAEEVVASLLHDRHLLLVLDNCEHLIGHCARLVDRLLTARGSTVLATSREVLGLEGEQWWPVGPLSLPGSPAADSWSEDSEAMSLLVDRVRAVRPGFVPGPADGEALAEICIRLDGIPLALELAAARAAHLTPREIADRLDDRFALLASSGRQRIARHQTLQTALDWSYDLLDGDERAVLRRSAMFSGGFTCEAAEGVCMSGVKKGSIDLLGSLVDKSLVTSEPDSEVSRYRLLETVRAYAREKLEESGEVDAIRALHRDWLLDVLERSPWDQSLLGEVAARNFRRDVADLQAALQWSEKQQRPDLLRRLMIRVPVPVYASGQFADGRHWLSRALDYEKTLPRTQWACHVLAEWVGQAQWTGERDEVQTSVSRLEDLVGDLPAGDPVTALAHAVLGVRLTVFPDRVDEMELHCELAVEHAGTSSPLIASWAQWFLAIAYLFQRRYDEATALVEQLHRSPERGTAVAVGTADGIVALTWHLQGRDQDTLELLEGKLSTPDVWRVSLYVMTAVARAALDDLPGARAQMREAVTTILGRGWRPPLAHFDCLIGLAVLAALEGDDERAARLIAPITAMSTPALGLLLRHYRELVHSHLSKDVRRRCIDEGFAMSVEASIEAELAHWKAEEVA